MMSRNTPAQLLLDLQESSGNENEFGMIDDDTISCRAGDCCIRRHPDGWEYAKNGQRYKTPTDAWQCRGRVPHYRYTVITQQNCAECDADPAWFKNHPDWTVLLRSDKKWPGRTVWICGGGSTVAEAKECLEKSLRELIYPSDVTVEIFDEETFVVGPSLLLGVESFTTIKD